MIIGDEKRENMDTDNLDITTSKLSRKRNSSNMDETIINGLRGNYRQLLRTKKIKRITKDKDLINKSAVGRILNSAHKKPTLRSDKDAKLVNQQSNTDFPQNPDHFGKTLIKSAKLTAPLTFPNTTGQIGKGLKWSTKKYF